nr:DUF4304 domain-containing protein [Kineosporia mesophila]
MAPRLRKLGFKGSGRKYDLDVPNHFVQVDFQSWRYNTAEHVRFTVNLSVISHAEWQRFCETSGFPVEPKPSAGVYGPQGPWVERLGSLKSPLEDKWWDIFLGRPTEPVVLEIVTAMEQDGLPEIRRRMVSRVSGEDDWLTEQD